MFGHFSLTYV